MSDVVAPSFPIAVAPESMERYHHRPAEDEGAWPWSCHAGGGGGDGVRGWGSVVVVTPRALGEHRRCHLAEGLGEHRHCRRAWERHCFHHHLSG